MIYLPVVLVFCIVVTVIAHIKYNDEITKQEFFISILLNIVIGVVSTIVTIHIHRASVMIDHEIHNGFVISKHKERVSCSHSYQICTSTGKTTTCQTHYIHSHDFDWVVKTSVDTLEIPRIDSQGTKTPPRWSKVIIGEPVSVERSFKNYLLADKESLFLESKHLISRFNLPSYPRVYDIYRYNRTIPSNPEINNYLNEELKTLGKSKELNIILVTTKEPPEYFNALMAHWKGGKKNDVILVFGLGENNNVDWFRANTYARGMNNLSMIHTLESATQDKEFSLELVKETVSVIQRLYNRIDAKEFKFKEDSIVPPWWLLIVLINLNILGSVGIMYWMRSENVEIFKPK